jgi:hypothetical protein
MAAGTSIQDFVFFLFWLAGARVSPLAGRGKVRLGLGGLAGVGLRSLGFGLCLEFHVSFGKYDYVVLISATEQDRGLGFRICGVEGMLDLV